MAGLNHVTRGGDPLTIALSPTLTLTKVSVGPMDNNAYLLTSGEGMLPVDAANDARTLRGLLGDRRLDNIVTTHRHRDHWEALADLGRTGARLWRGRRTPRRSRRARGCGSPTGCGTATS